MITSISTNKTIEEITKEIMTEKAELIDISAYRTSDYIKCEGASAEMIDGRLRVAFVRCPKCRKYLSFYKDEMSYDTTKPKRCMCGMIKSYKLKSYINKN